ncbi:MAG: (d)CMP kinase [Bacteroidales bacterium]|nr:(d)CMP kinase [Bacteroidales bacterium]
MEKKLITIAIDGFSSSGKSTMAKVLAKNIGYAYIDTGAMYRAVTLYCLNNNLIDGDTVNTETLEKVMPSIEVSFSVDPATGASLTMLNGENVEHEIRDMRVSNKVSIVAAIPFVRRALVNLQQKMGESKGIVMDGRDIGTVVFPKAEMKVYVDAPAETRAQRRFDELRAKGDTSTTYEEVLENVKHRDHLDQTREESPLRKAEDAISLDNSKMTRDEQNQWLLDLYHSIVSQQ